jgi:hypothetical protein
MQFSNKPSTQQYNQFRNVLWNLKKYIQNVFGIQIKHEVFTIQLLILYEI